MSSLTASSRTGVLQALGAYTLWGVFPLYFFPLRSVPPLEILAHRIVWCLVLLLGVLTLQRHWRWLGAALRQPRVFGVFCVSALLVAGNWYAYLWAMAAGHVIEAALGYFINPLMSVLIGAVVLHERLSRLQWLAIALASAGVALMGWRIGHLPWLSLVIAVTFSTYGLVRKLAPLGALEGLTLESLLLTPAALLLMAWLHHSGQAHFGGAGLGRQALIMLSGVATAVPLLLFAASARRIPMSWVGMLQYLSPTVQTLIGVLILGEALDARLQGFVLIWAACALFSLDLLRAHRRSVPRATVDPATMPTD